MLAAVVIYSLVMRYSEGEAQVKKIGDQIHKGALAFMKTEYQYLLVVVAVLVVLVGIFLSKESAIAVAVGAACSSLAGFIGMYAATKANVRTATAAPARRGSSSFDGLFLWRLSDGSMRSVLGIDWTWHIILLL